MNVKRFLAAMVVTCTVAAGAFAQDTPPPTGEGRGGGGRGPRGGRMDPMRYLRTLENFEQEVTRGLEADEELTNVIHDIFAEHLAPVREQAEKSRENRQGNADQMRDMMKQMREAQEAGDNERVKQLREQMAEMRRPQGEFTQVHDALFEDIRGELHDEELTKFDALVERFETRLGPNEGQGDEVRRIRQALASLTLTPEQRTKVREIISEHRRNGGEDAKNPEKAHDRAKALRDAIANELDDQQATQFEKVLADMDSHAGPEGQHQTGARIRRPGVPPTPPSAPTPGQPGSAPAPAPAEPAPADDSGQQDPPE